MKICFLQKQAFPYFGVMNLSGSLKASGAATDVVITNLERDFISTLKKCSPDLIAISLLSTEHDWLMEAASKIRAALPLIPIVVGGIHAILYPEEVFSIPGVDFVCTGEGEVVLPELCHALKVNSSLRNIAGLAYREERGGIVNAPPGGVIDLNAYREDRLVYYQRYEVLRQDELKQFIASRGCPYRCSFCYNERLHTMFPGQGSGVRMKSPLHLIEEIEAALNCSPIGSIFFADDLFAADKKWLRAFGELYRQRVNVPFMCNIRADRMDAETAEMLRDAGCHTVSFGVESGNEKLRMTVLNKKVTDEQIMQCATVLHAHGIRVQTSNMFGLPGEKLEDTLQTIRLNINIGTDIIFTSLFMPLPGTRLAGYCIEKGYLPADFGFADLPQSFMRHSILTSPDRVKIENLQRIAYFLIRFPALFNVAGYLTNRVTIGWFYAPWLYLGALLRYHEERKLSWWGAIKLLWHFRKSR